MTDSESTVIEYFTSRAGAFVNEPGENDVLLKKQAGNHKGNQRLLEDTEEFRERYKLATTIAEKKELAHQLLMRVKDRSGLFLKFNTATTAEEGRWCIQNYEESSLRVRQILRDTTGKTKLVPSHIITTGNGKIATASAMTSSLTPRIPRGNQHQHCSSEYLEACKLLSDDTMNQACELLLNTSNTDAKEQLLQIYQKCVQAARGIETELHNNPNPTAAFPMPPILRGRTGSLGITNVTTATNSTIHNKTKTVIPPVNRTRMVHPSEYPHRGSLGHGSSSNGTSHGVKGSVLAPSKKVRRAPSPPPAAVSSAALSSLSSVPESALQFLAKLNKEQDNGDAGEKKKAKKNENEEEEDSQSTTRSNDDKEEQEQSIDTKRQTAPPVRVQPSRSSKAN